MSPGATPDDTGDAGGASTPDGAAAPGSSAAADGSTPREHRPTPDGSEAREHRPTPDGSAPDSTPTPPDGDPTRTSASRRRDRRTATVEAPARAARRRRLQALAGVTVHGSDGKPVGRVRDIYQQDATGELAAITVMPRQLSAHSVLIPASAIASLPQAPEDHEDPDAAPADGAMHNGTPTADATPPDATPPTATPPDDADTAPDNVLRLLVTAATAKAGVHPPLTLHASPEVLRDAAAALDLERESPRI